MSKFWRIWLNACCYALILLGLGLSGAGIEGLEGFTDNFLWYLNLDYRPVFNPVERFALGLVGALTIGWGLTLLYFVQAAHNSNEGNRLWQQLALALLVWYVIDGYISYRTGFALNIASNTVLLLAFLVPLYVTGKLRR